MAKTNKKTKTNRTTEEFNVDMKTEMSEALVDQLVAVPATPDAKPEKQLTEEQRIELDSFTTISNKIRYLDKEMFTRGQIAKIVDKRYQHVRNVLATPLKRVVPVTK